MLIVLLITLILAAVCVVLFIPLGYEGELYIGRPFSIKGHLAWGKRLFSASWSYKEGEEIKRHSTACWKKKKAAPAPVKITQEEAEKAWQTLEEESEKTTYESLQQEKPDQAPDGQTAKIKNPPDEKDSLWPLILNADFLAALFTLLSRLLAHGQIRQLTLSGTIGLPQPHETGMLSGALYAICPGSVNGLRFNFIDEEYDCTLRASGRLYPAIVLIIASRFLLSPPVRRLVSALHTAKKGKKHGHYEHQE